MLADTLAFDAEAWIVDLAFVLTSISRADELKRLASKLIPTQWSAAAQALVRGDWEQTAELLHRIGSLPDEAVARWNAAETLLTEGRMSSAEPHRTHAISFWHSVGAVRNPGDSDAQLAQEAVNPQ